jgi:hypothetical protein
VLNIRDCRIYEAVAQRLVSRARALYAEDSVLGIDATIYALDASTVDLCPRLNRIAVGTHIAMRPPHKTGRAAFPHPAPTSGV